MGEIIQGKAIAQRIREKVKVGVEALKKEKGITPGLSVILVGGDPASEAYVRGKEKASLEAGINSRVQRLATDISQQKLLELIQGLNADNSVHGILVQLPLPKQLEEAKILSAISPAKDVDGLHPENMGKLLKGEDPPFIPCTPLGIMELIHSTGIEIKGKEAVVVGRSNIVGKPVAILLLKEHATVTICHSRTKDLAGVTKRADILVVAVGKAKAVTAEMVKKGAIVIDVGITRTKEGLLGDVDFKGVKEVALAITPVPGGVGPMTVAMLLSNVLKAAQMMALV